MAKSETKFQTTRLTVPRGKVGYVFNKNVRVHTVEPGGVMSQGLIDLIEMERSDAAGRAVKDYINELERNRQNACARVLSFNEMVNNSAEYLNRMQEPQQNEFIALVVGGLVAKRNEEVKELDRKAMHYKQVLTDASERLNALYSILHGGFEKLKMR